MLKSDLIFPVFEYDELLPFATGEYDGILVKTNSQGVVLNEFGESLQQFGGVPSIDINAMGVFRAELLGYDRIGYESTNSYTHLVDSANINADKYSGIIVYQRTCNSGTIVNTGSNEWCADWGIGRGLYQGDWYSINPDGENGCGTSANVEADTRLLRITRNIIYLMYLDKLNSTQGINNGDGLFEEPRNSNFQIVLTPTYTGLDYNVCSSGQVVVSPCGVQLTEGYKVDHGLVFENHHDVANHGNNVFSISIDANCTDFHDGLKSMSHQHINPIANNQPEYNFSIYPNPITNGAAHISLDFINQDALEYEIMDVCSNLVRIGKLFSTNTNIDLTGIPNGTYFFKVKGKLNKVQKIIVNSNE